MKLQDNFASLSVLCFEQTASVCVILQGFLETVTRVDVPVPRHRGRASSNTHKWLMYTHFTFVLL